jgi:hypothetical protein
MRPILLAAATLLGAHAPAYADCVTEPFSIPYFGGSAVTAMAARSGEPCSISGVTGGMSTISSVEVSAPPRNGTATVGQGYAVWYRSQPGFTGADVFEFAMSGTTEGRPGTSTVRVQVTVQ